MPCFRYWHWYLTWVKDFVEWFFWVYVIAQAINLLGLVFTFPGARYNRCHSSTVAQEVTTQASDGEKPQAASSEVDNQTVFNTIFEPEMRLPALIPFLLVSLIGLLVS